MGKVFSASEKWHMRLEKKEIYDCHNSLTLIMNKNKNENKNKNNNGDTGA